MPHHTYVGNDSLPAPGLTQDEMPYDCKALGQNIRLWYARWSGCSTWLVLKYKSDSITIVKLGFYQLLYYRIISAQKQRFNLLKWAEYYSDSLLNDCHFHRSPTESLTASHRRWRRDKLGTIVMVWAQMSTQYSSWLQGPFGALVPRSRLLCVLEMADSHYMSALFITNISGISYEIRHCARQWLIDSRCYRWQSYSDCIKWLRNHYCSLAISVPSFLHSPCPVSSRTGAVLALPRIATDYLIRNNLALCRLATLLSRLLQCV
jgi:hypothetical protein